MSLQKFIEAQNRGPEFGHGSTWDAAIAQLRRTGGKGPLHYAWYIFPQLAGVTQMVTGRPPTAISRYYEIRDLEQAVTYLENAYLRNHLITFATEMARIAPQRSIGAMLGIGDTLKFKSSMTLFLIAAVASRDDVALTAFRGALMRFGAPRLYENLDPITLTILRDQRSPLLHRVPRGVFSIIEPDEYPATDGDGDEDADFAAAIAASLEAQGGAADTMYTPPWSPREPQQVSRPPRGFDEVAAQEELINAFDQDYLYDMDEPLSLIEQIVALGFSVGDAASALARANPPGNVPAAVRLLLDEQDIPAAAAAPASPRASRRRRASPGRLAPSVQGSSRRPRVARSRTPAKKWPKVTTQSGTGRHTRRRRRKRYTKKRRRRRRRGKRKTRRRNK